MDIIERTIDELEQVGNKFFWDEDNFEEYSDEDGLDEGTDLY